jgi:hypothetical protein
MEQEAIAPLARLSAGRTRDRRQKRAYLSARSHKSAVSATTKLQWNGQALLGD